MEKQILELAKKVDLMRKQITNLQKKVKELEARPISFSGYGKIL